MTEPGTVSTFEGRGRAAMLSAVIGAAGLIAWVVGFALQRQRALFSLLVAYCFLATIVAGALALLMMLHAARAEWPVVVRRLVEALVSTGPLLVVFFIPVAFTLGTVFPWAGALRLDEHARSVVRHQGLWWNHAFYLGRTAFYLLTWIGPALLLRRWSLRQDRDGELHWSRSAERLSSGGLVLLGFTLTFASYDWMMSLAPAWQSSMFGIYVFAGGFVAALSVLVLLMARSRDNADLRRLIGPGHYLSVGKLVFAHVIFWAYTAFGQYFIIWIADLPHEASWWVTRSTGWGVFSLVLAAGHFAVPFAILLGRDLKRDPRKLGAIALWLVVFHYVDIYWLVMPALSPSGPQPHWLDLAALAMVAGFAISFGIWRARGVPVAPLRAPGFGVSTRYEGT